MEVSCFVNREPYEVLDTASFLRCSMKTCKLTSSVRTGAPAASWPQANMLLWVWDGFTLDNKKRAWEQTKSVLKTRVVTQTARNCAE